MGLAGFAAISFVVGNGPPAVFVLVAVVVGASGLWRASVLLRVDGDGVRIGRGLGYAHGDTRVLTTTVPWSSVDDVLVVSSGVGDEQVAVRLRPDAPLPGPSAA